MIKYENDKDKWNNTYKNQETKITQGKKHPGHPNLKCNSARGAEKEKFGFGYEDYPDTLTRRINHDEAAQWEGEPKRVNNITPVNEACLETTEIREKK